MTLRELQAILAYRLGVARYLFIHIPKNAGVAINRAPALQYRVIRPEPFFHKSRAYTRELAKFMKSRGEHHGFQHARWRDLHPNVQKRLRAVALVRNPWARVVSRYRYARTAIAMDKARPDYIADTFEGFLEERHEYGDLPFFWHRAIRGWYPQADYVTDETGALRVDVLRLEAMNEEVTRYFGLSEPVAKRNVSIGPEQDYRRYYTPQTIQVVADWYARDIRLFGFDFDTLATRNTFYTGPAAQSAVDTMPQSTYTRNR